MNTGDFTAPDNATVTHLADRAFKKFAGKTFLDFEGGSLTYAQVGTMTNRLTREFSGSGLDLGDAVALYFPNSPYQVIGLLAALGAGCRVVLLSPLDALRELEFKLADSGARILLTLSDEPFLSNAHSLVECGIIDRVIHGRAAHWQGMMEERSDELESDNLFQILSDEAPMPPQPEIVIEPQNLALIQYSGGTTGTPKGALLTHDNLMASVTSIHERLVSVASAKPGEERVLCVLPLFHIFALTAVLLRAMIAGDTVILRERFDARHTLNDIEQHQVSWLLGVATMYIALIGQEGIERRNLSSLTCCIAGGASMPVEVASRFRDLTGVNVAVGWGMTETTGAGTLADPTTGEKAGSIGRPLPGCQIEIVSLDDPSQVLPVGQDGEIRIRGRNVTSGYWNQPEETASAFRDGFLLTGDIGRQDVAGYLYIVDRKKDLIISGGFNVYPKLVEDAIYEHEAVEEVCVFAIADAYRGESAKAAVKLREGFAPFMLEELRAFLSSRLGKHELPAALEFREALPRTAVGKLSRRELVMEERARTAAVTGTKGEIA
jgi:long-chain acyl-CoA synthetase